MPGTGWTGKNFFYIFFYGRTSHLSPAKPYGFVTDVETGEFAAPGGITGGTTFDAGPPTCSGKIAFRHGSPWANTPTTHIQR
jgi:hypothetical protein